MSHESCEDYETHQQMKKLLVPTKQIALPSFLILHANYFHKCFVEARNLKKFKFLK